MVYIFILLLAWLSCAGSAAPALAASVSATIPTIARCRLLICWCCDEWEEMRWGSKAFTVLLWRGEQIACAKETGDGIRLAMKMLYIFIYEVSYFIFFFSFTRIKLLLESLTLAKSWNFNIFVFNGIEGFGDWHILCVRVWKACVGLTSNKFSIWSVPIWILFC